MSKKNITRLASLLAVVVGSIATTADAVRRDAVTLTPTITSYTAQPATPLTTAYPGSPELRELSLLEWTTPIRLAITVGDHFPPQPDDYDVTFAGELLGNTLSAGGRTFFIALPPSTPTGDVGVLYTNRNTGITPSPGGSYYRLRLDASRAIEGDADLNGTVGFDDLLALAQNYGATTGSRWATGDFNFDAATDFADLLALAQNYGSSASFESDWAAARLTVGIVPEPALAAVILLAPLTALRRRRDGSAR